VNLPVIIADKPAVIAVATAKPAKAKKAKVASQVARVEKVHVSSYWPADGGTNCATFVDGTCVSHTASGRDWQAWIDTGSACVKEWPIDTKFRMPDGRIFTCVDRGGAIKYGYTPSWMESDGLGWIDLLTESPGYSFGAVVEVEILK